MTSHLGTQTSAIHCNLLIRSVFNYKQELQSQWVCRFNWCSDRVWFMLHSARRAMKYPMRARQGYIKRIPVNLQHSTAQEPSLCFFPSRQMPKSLFLWACFSERKPDPTGCQCHQWPPVLLCHSIPCLFLSGMHFSHSFLFSLPLFSGPWCPRPSGGSVCLVVPDLFILSGEMGYSDLLCVQWSQSQAPVW